MHDHSSTVTAPYISIKEASIRYQKAEITIRRFVRSILEQEKSAERGLVHPLPSDAVKLKKMRKPFAYTISEELLKKHYGEGSAGATSHGSSHGSYMHLLERTNRNLEDQLKVKDEQIRVLAQAIDGLSERQRETNVLMKGLQERFFLSGPKEEIVDAVSEVAPKNAKQKAKAKAKKGRGFFGWWRS